MSVQIMQQFYEAFASHDAKTMSELYHKEVVFNDPVFQQLNQREVQSMWQMLIERTKGNLDIEFHSLAGDHEVAQCTWEAKYSFSATQRQVHNIIHAHMEFKDGLIYKHVDNFDLWRWSKMALGTPGVLLGWTPFMQKKIRKMGRSSLNSFMAKR